MPSLVSAFNGNNLSFSQFSIVLPKRLLCVFPKAFSYIHMYECVYMHVDTQVCCMCMHMYVCGYMLMDAQMYAHVYAYVCGGQRLMLNFFLNFSPLYLLEQSFSLNLELDNLAGPVNQPVPVSSFLCLLSAEVTGELVFLIHTCHGDLNSVPHICVVSTHPLSNPLVPPPVPPNPPRIFIMR